MHVSETAVFPPHVCALTGTSSGPFVITDVTLPGFDPRIQVGVAGLKTLAAEYAGMVDADAHDKAIEERDAAVAEVERLKVELGKATRLADAIDVLQSADFTARKKTGRPKKEVGNE